MRNRRDDTQGGTMIEYQRPVRQLAGLALAVALAVAFATAAQAAYLEDVPQRLVQPDGTVVECFASGDEYYHWLHDADGYVIVQDPASGYFTYATRAGDELVATACRAGACDPRTLGVEPRLKPGRALLQSRYALFAEPELAQAPRPEGAPTFTLLNNLVVFVRFSDETEFTNPLSYYNNLLNATTGVSLFNYFKEASYNQTTISSSFYPTGGATVVSYQSPNPRAYYQPYNATTNPQGYNGDDERTSREHALIKAAVEYIAPYVPTSLDIDTNHDGRVDNVTVIVRGAADGWSDLLWPHRWSLYTVAAYINGTQVYAYNFQLDASLGVSVLCHEMGHTLGAPDLYHYDDCSSNPDLDPVWRWDLMSNNRTPPQHSGAYVKKKYFGWISTIPEITTSGTYTLNPITSSTNNAYRIASPNSTSEYFVLEYRRATGTFESSLPGSGLLVYRVYPDADPMHPGNRCGPPDEVYIYRPNGTTTVNGDPASAAFSADTGRTTINDSTNPSSFLSDGNPGGLNISNVTTAGNTISFTVTLGGGCTYSITPTSTSVAASGGSGSVSVTTSSGCSWTATSNAGWITVTSGSSGSGNGSVGYSVAANAGASRTGTITIAGQTFTVNQAGAGGGGGEVTIFSDAFEGGLAASWWVSGTTTWGHSTYRAAGGSGSAWCAGGGTSPQSPGSSYVSNQASWMVYGPFSLADATAASAEFDVWMNTEMEYDFVKWMISVNGTNFWGVEWSGNSGGWQHKTFDFADVTSITALGASQVWFAFIFRSDDSLEYEGAYVDNLVIKKTTAGGGCSYSIAPTSTSVAASGGSGTVSVTAGAGCTWTATSNAGWITVTSGSSGSGNGSVGYSVAANSSGARSGTITIAGQTFTVNQAASGGGGAYAYYVPAIAHNPGANSTQWRSDISVVNTSGLSTTITLTYYSSSAPVERSASVPAGGTVKWVNVVESLFGVFSGTSTQGTVIISSNVPLAIVARTYNQTASGTYGQYYPAVRLAHTIGQGQVGYLPALEKSGAFRTNVGAINLGSSTCSVQFTVLTAGGSQAGSAATLSVPAERWAQLNDLFGAAGAGSQSVAYAKVQPLSSGCQVWAYGSVVDAATGDPTTIPLVVP